MSVRECCQRVGVVRETVIVFVTRDRTGSAGECKSVNKGTVSLQQIKGFD